MTLCCWTFEWMAGDSTQPTVVDATGYITLELYAASSAVKASGLS